MRTFSGLALGRHRQYAEKKIKAKERKNRKLPTGRNCSATQDHFLIRSMRDLKPPHACPTLPEHFAAQSELHVLHIQLRSQQPGQKRPAPPAAQRAAARAFANSSERTRGGSAQLTLSSRTSFKIERARSRSFI